MASLIEQSADSSVASSMSEFKILKLYILPPLSPLAAAPRVMSRLALCTLNFHAEPHYGILKLQ